MAIYPDLEDRNVLITGGAHGIGSAAVHAFHRQRARVFFCDLDEQGARKLAASFPCRVYAARVDLREETQVRDWIDQIIDEWGQIDVLVNNAAIDPRIPLKKLTRERWDNLLNSNLRAHLFTSQEAAPAMPAGGSIINLSSITVHLGPENMTAYVASKAGIIGFSRSLARELGKKRIRVNVVSPGWVMTPRQLRDYVTPEVKKLLHHSQAIPDLIQPEEIAAAILFLASEASRAITGQELLVDRGWAHS